MPANPRPARPREDLPSVVRLLTLFGNVVAIALTLLVFQLKVPAVVQVADPGSAADLAAQLVRARAFSYRITQSFLPSRRR